MKPERFSVKVLIVATMAVFLVMCAVFQGHLSSRKHGGAAYADGCECCEYWPDDFTGECPNWNCLDSNDSPDDSWCYEKVSQIRDEFRQCSDMIHLTCATNHQWSCLRADLYYYTKCNFWGNSCSNKYHPSPGNPLIWYMPGCQEGQGVEPCLE